MIDLPPIPSTVTPGEKVEALAAAIADMIAHIYQYARTELEKLPPDPAGELLLDKVFELVADVHEIANFTSGETAREVLGDRASH